MNARIAARWARVRGRRVVLVGALVALAVVTGALALPSSSQLLAGAAAPADPDAAGGLQRPNAAPHDKTLGGAATVSREALQPCSGAGAAISSAGGSWEYAGANNIGGRVTDVVVDPTQANTIYVASAGGGVWKSTDAGLTYTPAWPNDYPQAIGSLARGSDGTLWAGTGEANASGGGITYVGDGVYKSTDGGATWTNVGLGNAGHDRPHRRRSRRTRSVVLVAASGSIYSTGGKRGLYRTIDGGAHWAPVLVPDLNAAPYTGAVDVAFDPVNPNRVYATLWDHHRSSYLRPYGGIGSGPLRDRQRARDPGVGRDVGADRQLARERPAADATTPSAERARRLDDARPHGRRGRAERPHARLPDHGRVARQRQGLLRLRQRRPLARGRRPDLRRRRPRGRQPALRVVVRPALRRPGEQEPPLQDGRQPAPLLRRRPDVGERRRPARRPARRWPGIRTCRTACTSATTAACTAPTRTATAAGCTARTCRGSRSTTSPSRRRGRTGSRSGSRTTARTAAGRTSTTPSPTRWPRTGASYGGGDGHYVVIDCDRRHVLLLVQPERRLQRRPRRRARPRRRSRRRPPWARRT